ncbi:hypothetical protein MM239_19345 [Belliella sp. DSM 111904]|uniref:SusD family protein n=1 Tax=Belliella filtrata TaxID=2923435 RepID=A0ABS9V557_9BACT|nr:hypothetical protein [Belliella filtrata]MCH7411551.1 hypothetical protein [Belliella filtrata]
MKKLITYISFIILASFGLYSCDLFDVTNPYVTEDRFINSPQAAAIWMNGLKRQSSLTVGTVVEFTELVSDNYFNNYTQSSKVFDFPEINYFDIDVRRVQTSIHLLLETARFGLEKVLPNDPEATAIQEAECIFIMGYAHLLAAELFVAMPESPNGQVLTPTEHLDRAIQYFTQAQGKYTAANDQLICDLALARANHSKGDRQAARNAAARVTATNPSLLKQVFYGTQSGPSNNFQNAIFSGTINQFAPLPRLDFLDPKYFNLTSVIVDDQKPISILKAEEAFLILAEAALSEGNIAEAKSNLSRLITEVIAIRPVTQLDDSRETRNGGNRNDYPLSAVAVRFDSSSPWISGLVLDRQAGKINAYSVSGTHVTVSDIEEASSVDELLYLTYLIRQEVFFAEGRRMTDLGIRFPISELEFNNNSNVNESHLVTQLPTFIPLDLEMDDFSVDPNSGIVTIRHDMNKVLIANKQSNLVIPFF